MNSPSGSSRTTARSAVGAVSSALIPYLSIICVWMVAARQGKNALQHSKTQLFYNPCWEDRGRRPGKNEDCTPAQRNATQLGGWRRSEGAFGRRAEQRSSHRSRTSRRRCAASRIIKPLAATKPEPPYRMSSSYPPPLAGVRGADGLAFVQHGRASLDQRSVRDVRVAHHPAHLRNYVCVM